MSKKDTRTHRGRNSMRGQDYINGEWVYYQSLNSYDVYPILRDFSIPVYSATIDYLADLNRLSDFFLTASDQELAKEQAMLEKVFGVSVSGAYDQQNYAKDLLTAINECMGLKNIFQRNLALIKSTSKTKNVISYFHTYFQQIWNNAREEIFQETVNKIEGSSNLDFGEALANTIKEKLNGLVKKAIKAMFSAEPELQNGLTPEEYEQFSHAYDELKEALEKEDNGQNLFIQSFIKTYHLNEMVELVQKAGFTKDSRNDFINQNFNFDSNIHYRGGINMEYFIEYAINMVAAGFAGIHGSDSVKYSLEGARQVGATQQKADAIASAGVSLDIIDKWLEDNKKKFGTREENIRAIKTLQAELNKFDDGFITYVNAKNYKLDSEFQSRGGFKAGEAISLRSFSAIADILNVDYDLLVRSCLQLIPGAIGADKMEQTKVALTEAIASALFDDFNVIGKAESGTQSIHLLYLNGVLMPISFYFYLLGHAIFDAATREGVVQVSISTPGQVMFKQEPPWPPGSRDRWQTQRDTALDEIKITYRFLAAFQSIMQQFM